MLIGQTWKIRPAIKIGKYIKDSVSLVYREDTGLSAANQRSY